jgi:hypothetical protein
MVRAALAAIGTTGHLGNSASARPLVRYFGMGTTGVQGPPP